MQASIGLDGDTMAVEQPLKGGKNKIYSVIGNLNEGINKNTADDVSSDTSFVDLVNFYNSVEGSLSKRPAVYDSYLTDFIKDILDNNYSEFFNIVTNDFGETKEVLINRLQDFYDTIILGNKKEIVYQDLNQTRTFKMDKIIGLQIIKNNKFLEALQDYKTILDGEYSNVVGSSYIEFSCIFVAGGFSTIIESGLEGKKLCGLYITRVKVVLDYDEGIGYTVKLEIDSVDPTISNSTKRRWLYCPEGYNFKPGTDITEQYIKEIDDYIPLEPIDIVNYNGYSYIATGYNYLIKIDQIPDNKDTHATYTNEASLFQVIGGDDEENLYKPTAVELTQVGFNILANDPLSFIDVSGTVAKVKGVFYSLNISKDGEEFKQPITTLPYNSPFNIHVLYTGTTLPNKIEYRIDNGETDTEKNPYQDLPGDWEDASKRVFICSGIDSDQKFELRVTLGDDNFITYVTTSTAKKDETGYINEINDLVLSSTRVKLINNQLVLYGNHGYIFFSEYDLFNYFPNYYYLFIANEAGEESVTSINYFRQFYAIFTNKRIKRMTGNFGANNFGIYPLNDFIGCAKGKTVRAVGNNLIFLGNDGIYQLKQGYLGEGTENIEKLDDVLNGELNLNNVIQAFTLNDTYIVVKNDGYTWIIYNATTKAFYEYNLESETGQVFDNGEVDKKMTKKYLPFFSIFEANSYDANGNFLVVPMYEYNYNYNYTSANLRQVKFMTFRYNDISYIETDRKHKDGYGYISSLETHKLNMGYPMNTKKFKDIYIKLENESGHVIPLYVTIYVDDKLVLDPEHYEIVYDKLTNTYYYVELSEHNAELVTSKVLGEFTLGEDPLGNKTIQQIKFRVGETGRSIKILLRDGYNDTTIIGSTGRGIPTRERNIHDFSILTIGIVYKVKKVKEG